jgi:sigma-B regulation protein RsbU (phosphoserine phosphatase)
MGAADYLTKPFNPVLLHARIGACLEKKQLRDQERLTFLALEASQQALAAELAEAADYVRSLLPPPSRRNEITVDWRFVPSMQLGGDAFGHQWLDGDRLVLYLFDVCGHGVGAALLSVAIIDAVRSGRMHGADMGDPGSVLRALNDAFPMELHNGQYFTMWYGVYDRRTRTLVHASGGHPAALLIAPSNRGVTITQVRQPGMIVGGMPDVDYRVGEITVPPGARLYVFSDGLFEVSNAGRMVPYDDFLAIFEAGDGSALAPLDRVVSQMRSLASGQFDDDVSIMEVAFD